MMRLVSKPFHAIQNGQKTIESRLYDEKRQLIRIGDEIEFQENSNEAHIIRVKVVELHKHETFSELFSHFPPANFGGDSIEELLAEIHTFYSREDEKKYGVVGIEFTRSHVE